MNEEAKRSYITTAKFAAKFGVRPESIRHSLCVRGHYLGLRPIKGGNGRLLWPEYEPEELFERV